MQNSVDLKIQRNCLQLQQYFNAPARYPRAGSPSRNPFPAAAASAADILKSINPGSPEGISRCLTPAHHRKPSAAGNSPAHLKQSRSSLSKASVHSRGSRSASRSPKKAQSNAELGRGMSPDGRLRKMAFSMTGITYKGEFEQEEPRVASPERVGRHSRNGSPARSSKPGVGAVSSSDESKGGFSLFGSRRGKKKKSVV